MCYVEISIAILPHRTPAARARCEDTCAFVRALVARACAGVCASGCDVTQYEAALTARREFGCDDGRSSSSAILPEELQTLLSSQKRGKRARFMSKLRRLTKDSRRSVTKKLFDRGSARLAGA